MNRAATDLEEGHAGYAGLAADLYDLIRGDSPLPNEFSFYRRRLEDHPGPALEASCGTGRILLQLLAAGFDVDGMDASADMLRLCRAKASTLGLAPVLYQQLMQRMDIPRSYDTIFIPLASFMLMTDIRDARQALQCFFHHLRPRGDLLFSTHLPPGTGSGRSDWMPYGTLFHPVRGLVRVSIAGEVDSSTQIAIDFHRLEVMDGDAIVETVVHPIRLRWYRRDEMIEFLEAAGFRDIRVWGHHTEREAGPDDTVLVFGARRPE